MNELRALDAIGEADVVVVGPAPPLRGGIAQHTARLVEACHARGLRAVALSYRRLYPGLLFPGRSQRTSAESPEWVAHALDVLRPDSWLAVRRRLAESRAKVVAEWWHPVTAPALAVATGGVAPDRLVAICHNVRPHEPVPGSGLAARSVLGRARRIVFHSRSEMDAARTLLGDAPADRVVVPLPCLLPLRALEATATLPELGDIPGSARIVGAAGHVRSYKGTDTLVRAWSLARRPDDARLVIVGESYLGRRERGELARAIREEPTIVFVDRYVDDAELASFVSRAEVLVLPHRAASQSGLVPLARLVGTPLVVTDAGGLAEQAGPGAAVARCEDAGGLATLLERRLAEIPADASARSSSSVSAERRDVEQTFAGGWQRVVEAIGAPARPQSP